jgi:hypothetical protein
LDVFPATAGIGIVVMAKAGKQNRPAQFGHNLGPPMLATLGEIAETIVGRMA